MLSRTITTFTLAGLALAPVALSAKPPPVGPFTLSLAAKPSPVVFSTPASATGKLVGTDVGGVSVTLEEDTTVPLGDKFTPTDKATTGADGAYSFAIAPSVNTQYRSVAKTKPDTQSAAVLVKVRPRVDVTVSDLTRTAGARVTFAGAVLPARDGASAVIQRRRPGGWKTVGKATLADAGAEQSSYTKDITVRRDGTYRVKVPKDAEHVAGVSSRQKLNVA